ncbi:glycosyltransferase family 4 protein [Herbaspirillum sp. SJZ107]|uniref:glycosyltransferase family 4 protein n=1 Tax=Herbaspirillum sp. SJZ107 TaxID=2572881 RepID=UPI00114DC9A5|nr:glycosyltransferase family 4 protein [Herbaspirillum sp. SJZ107]TQK10924.1 glycosyltransferase involved in cell wall biosynthesis [Herbaspirillum sp. SJZ107]
MAAIVHLTSAHPRYDTRIFVKQCRSLAALGHTVTLVVADALGDERIDGVQVIDVGRLEGRANRVLRTTRRVLQAARRLDADVYQLHDPELVPAGLRLKRLGKTVIFDSHEDVPAQLLAKPYLSPLARRLLSAGYAACERRAYRRFDGLVAATPFIRERLQHLHPNTVDVNNYPMLQEFDAAPDWDGKVAEVCYVGSISAIRGIRELVRACELLRSPARLSLVGSFAEPALEREVAHFPGWKRVDAHGHLGRAGVQAAMRRAVAGLVTLHPVVNYLDALPVKMFEYMAAGLPVIASRFPLWQEIVEGNGCGVCVDPGNPAAIAAAIDHFCLHPQVARRMGENGRRAVLARYNWHSEAAKLAGLYDSLLAARAQAGRPAASGARQACS